MARIDKWIEIVEAGTSPTGITKRWLVLNKREGSKVGAIKWYGAFRAYCFFPEDDTLLYDSDCLRKIAEFLEKVNIERRSSRRTTTQSALSE